MYTTECRLAIEQLQTHLEDPENNHDKEKAALRHMLACSHCNHRMEYLVQAITTNEDDRLTCQQCQALLPYYLHEEPSQREEEPEWGLVTLHLKTCPHCANDYEILSRLTALAFDELEEEPLRYPEPDLSFLRSKPVEIPWRFDKVGHLIIELTADLVRAWQTPAFQPAYVKSRKSQKVLCQLSLQGPAGDMEVTITTEELGEDATHCALMVEVNIPARGGWPNLADTEVTVKRDGTAVATQQTDAFGKVYFKEIATDDLARLAFEIMPQL